MSFCERTEPVANWGGWANCPWRRTVKLAVEGSVIYVGVNAFVAIAGGEPSWTGGVVILLVGWGLGRFLCYVIPDD